MTMKDRPRYDFLLFGPREGHELEYSRCFSEHISRTLVAGERPHHTWTYW